MGSGDRPRGLRLRGGAWPDRPRSLRDDALFFINLLSVTHGLGLQSTGYIYDGVEREIERLVGNAPSSWSSRMGTRGGHANMVVPAAPELSMARFSEAKRLFLRMHEAPGRLRWPCRGSRHRCLGLEVMRSLTESSML